MTRISGTASAVSICTIASEQTFVDWAAGSAWQRHALGALSRSFPLRSPKNSLCRRQLRDSVQMSTPGVSHHGSTGNERQSRLTVSTLLKSLHGRKRVAVAAALVCRNPEWWPMREHGDGALTVDALLEISPRPDVEMAIGQRGWRIDTR